MQPIENQLDLNILGNNNEGYDDGEEETPLTNDQLINIGRDEDGPFTTCVDRARLAE